MRGALNFEAPIARLGGVSVTPSMGFTLARGASRTIALTRTAAFPAGEVELVVLRESSGERRAVTVRE